MWVVLATCIGYVAEYYLLNKIQTTVLLGRGLERSQSERFLRGGRGEDTLVANQKPEIMGYYHSMFCSEFAYVLNSGG